MVKILKFKFFGAFPKHFIWIQALPTNVNILVVNMKKTIHVFLYIFWVKVFYTVSGYAIMEMYPNAWNI